MKLPQLTPPHFTHASNRPERAAVATGVEPQDCDVLKTIACAGALVACAVVCFGTGGTGCAPCLAALGMGSCIDCL